MECTYIDKIVSIKAILKSFHLDSRICNPKFRRALLTRSLPFYPLEHFLELTPV